MLVRFVRQVGSAVRNLNPAAVRKSAERPVRFGVLAADEECVGEIHRFLRPERTPAGRYRIIRIASEEGFSEVSAGFSERGVPHPAHFYAFDPLDPNASASTLLDGHESEWLRWGCNFAGLRRPISERLIWKISKENALFAITTSLPNIVPTALLLPWSVGEFASDTAFVTMNQVRLSFLLAATHGHVVGYDHQTIQVGSIAGVALGWRALARQLASKLPAGVGLVPKSLIAFAGTYAVGRGLEHWFRTGSPLETAAQSEFFEDARRQGRDVVGNLVDMALSPSRADAGQA